MHPKALIDDTAAAMCMPSGILWCWQTEPAFQARLHALGGQFMERPIPIGVRLRAEEKARLARAEEHDAIMASFGPEPVLEDD